MAKRAVKSRAKKGTTRNRSTSRRELIDTGRNKMFAKRRADGTFSAMDDVGRSLSSDRRRTSKRATKSGFGDQGDRSRAARKKR